LKTPKGDKARRHDEMVENLIALLQHWDNELDPGSNKCTPPDNELDCLHFSIENPTEGLVKRLYEYMNKGWIERVTDRSEVNYCVYQHMYMKLTHIWCTIPGWEPNGMSGNELCRTGGIICNMGSIGEKVSLRNNKLAYSAG
jgi:hypothetical protein